MPRPTPRTTPNRSSDDSRIFAQLHRKLPIGYNVTPHIRLTKLSSPVHRYPNPPPASSLYPSYLPFQIDQPFCHNALTERPTDGWRLEEMFDDYRPLSLYID